MLRRQTEQRLECGHRRSAAVEAEDELVDVVRQMLGADAVVGAREPGLEVREGAVDPREQLRGVLRVALGGRFPRGRPPMVLSRYILGLGESSG